MALNPWLIICACAAALVDFLAPLALALFFARFCRGNWRHWAIGAAVFLVFQVFTRIPVIVFLQTLPSFQAALKEPVWMWLFFVESALTAALFEEGGRWLAIRFVVPPAERRWSTALMMGAGHGGVESIGIGVLVLLTLVGYLSVASMNPEAAGPNAQKIVEAREHFAKMQGWEPLLGAWERLATLVVHVAFTVMVLQSFTPGRRWWWWCALAAHALVDLTVPGIVLRYSDAWGEVAAGLTSEALVTVYALLGLWLILALRTTDPAPPEADLAAKPAEFEGQAKLS
jgi:uncharacterized membrane protein YhfC